MDYYVMTNTEMSDKNDFSTLVPETSFGLRELSLFVFVSVSVRPCVNPELSAR